MKIATFLFGALSGAAFVSAILLAVEIVRVYREIDVDPWQEFSAEETPAKPFDWERWKTFDEINQERKAKNEFYNREDDDL
jgi:hypothetical protein